MKYLIPIGIAVPLIGAVFYSGYWLGQRHAQDEYVRFSNIAMKSNVSLVEQPKSLQDPDGVSGAESLLQSSAKHGHQPKSVKYASGQTFETEQIEQQGQNTLENLGKAMADSANRSQQTLAQRSSFEQNFTEQDRDWLVQTQVSDFLQLHDKAAQIHLHKLDCSEQRCQMLGQFDGDHQMWASVLKEMQQQDWWSFTGTSNTSSTENATTYFNVFLDRQE